MTTAGPARLVTFEGGEGAGKTTQIALLAERLRRCGQTVVVTREPGGTPDAEAIRALLVEGEAGRWDPLAETLLHLAARRQHLARKVFPALERGDWVLCDRFLDSTRAYQGAGQAVPLDVIDALAAPVMEGLEPGLTVILDLAPEDGLARAAARSAAGRYERWPLARHQTIRQAFLAIAANEPDRCRVLDAMQSVDAVAAGIWQAVAGRFPDLGPC
ncbi:MAG: dTMP kinase [Alphaproteobacteria bacterium]|nr:dTMP kinase [Alphaproteobacteria bacterium]MCB9928096.1 dTMP kinase [Alphaproteobacteria bacterium]